MSDQRNEKSTKIDAEGGQRDTQIHPKLLEMLVCPITHGPLRFDREKQELISDQAGLAYPIRDGIPIMLSEEARVLDDESGS